jgi:DNA-binding MltR family transcriptional regulator
MVIIDLGGLFKIHTVKLWNRLEAQSHNLGVFLYADDEILGGIAELKNLYNFRANDQVYARKIYLKQSLAKLMMFREVQVFGSGPFNENEVY